MKTSPFRVLNDIVYQELFGKNTVGLLIYFNLSPLVMRDTDDNALRDCMGIEALTAIGAIEHECVQALEGEDDSGFEVVQNVVKYYATEIAIEAKAAAAGRGVDLLTGIQLEVQ